MALIILADYFDGFKTFINTFACTNLILQNLFWRLCSISENKQKFTPGENNRYMIYVLLEMMYDGVIDYRFVLLNTAIFDVVKCFEFDEETLLLTNEKFKFEYLHEAFIKIYILNWSLCAKVT